MALTTNLKLRIPEDATADARFNLNKIDSLGGSTLLDNAGNLRIRSTGNILLEPESADIGGAGSGGSLSLGESGTNVDSFDIFADDTNITNGDLNLQDGLLKFTDGTNYVAFQQPGTYTGDTTWILPGDDGTAGQLLATDGAGQLSWTTVIGSSLLEYNVEVGNAGNVRTSVDTNSVGDILADSTNGLTLKAGVITNADINSAAAVTLSKLAPVTASRALASDGSGVISATSVTSTELGYLSGATSNLQAQINAIGGANQLAATWSNADGATKTVTHNFGTRNVAVQVLDNNNNYINVEVEEIARPNDNDVTLTSTEAPVTNWTVLVFQVGS